VYTSNIKKGDTYLPFRKEFTIEMDNCTYQQKKELMFMAFVFWTLYFTSSTRILMRSREKR
jgi:hypothetical protein